TLYLTEIELGLVPFRKVQAPPAVLDVVLDEPRAGSDVRVQRPRGAIGVAVGARAVEQSLGPRVGESHFACARRIVVRAPVRDQLDQDENGDRSERHPY